METVTDVLKATGTATARKIAARLGIEVRDALEMLREQQEAGAVEFLNGYWSLSGVTTKTTEYREQEPEPPEETGVKIGETQLLEAIKKQGPQTADELATMFGITSRKVTSTLAMATGKGRLIRAYQNGRYYYLLEDEMLPETPETSQASADGGTEAGRIFPAPRFISAEIRRTEAKLKRLIKFREISRELHKPGNRRLLVQFFENNTDSEV
ncbi:DUF1627 domain-containing protein [Salmonella enterica]|nr:DUF1627 domain-containing protein [Salmonella enterica]EHL6881126.1 DUF1627 domain-containing protein [Salmonella enterica]EHL6896098.1 DUF1627 domain-containing protein [Salmonella enterica]EHL6909908.1 DUF1627 domain-containing protein [Salmonella enterica]EIB2628734.1 DUF1627 domain-containing protein [Salmonella enterica]